MNATPHNIRPVRHIQFLRMIAKLLPLGHRLYPLVRQYSLRSGLIAINFGKYDLLYPADWLNPLRSHIIFSGPDGYADFRLFKSIFTELKDGTIIDVGANFGEWVLMTRECIDLPIVAYEPSPVSASIMQQSVIYNNLKNIDVRNKACGNSNSNIVLETGIVSYIDHSDQDLSNEAIRASDITEAQANRVTEGGVPVLVEQVRLDDDLSGLEKISLLKIDCEGYEYEILQGTKEIIESHRPHIYIEIHPGQIEAYGHSPKDVLDFLRPYYNMKLYGDGKSFADEQEALDAVAKATPPNHMAGWPIRFQIAAVCVPK